ncbi:MAG: Crp/Fnr family transcriptional regulator [Coriobacteriia bacterium]|nr:Crp/Fnr family transcriptional regulator [Coriobacteriia bacterium]
MDYLYLKRSVLFEGLTRPEIEEMLPCLDPKVRTFKKGEVIYRQGSIHRHLGLILEGDVRIEHIDAWDNITLLTIMEQGKTFGEANAVLDDPLAADFIADHDCKILFLNIKKIMQPCAKGCANHRLIASNLTKLLARRNLEMNRRAFITAPRGIRTRVMGYLSLAGHAYGAAEFDIPYNREQLAQYLGVDRSALSAELSRMAKDGLIEFRKNHFKLTSPDLLD